MFDLPEPFGPTTTATPGSRASSSGSGNDLKPRMRIVFRCTETGILAAVPDGSSMSAGASVRAVNVRFTRHFPARGVRTRPLARAPTPSFD